ncbi:DMT family transporter [Psychrobium sp. 1_MG-2023]|uniref:DMT family transporter n=1 Tax=Psychrobium sp. 1_MG-2023 TaxID=3062624 RepID=UPI000C334289|nr:DMT family transporter [Psychrobium sp. 1_MG-2023]MDP2559606.1 DMT family transporter [Psychrobium sp. 1_MG-2023]PKF59440.1 multidrug transporter [Alteromonadales bacterium alter-6D02]
MWIYFTLLAASMQSWRNAFQSKLSQEVNVTGVTLARFIWAGPIAALYLLGLYQWQDASWPQISPALIFFIVGASLMQIIATALMVKLFQLNNFAVGAGLAKSEALVAAILGTIFFGTSLTWFGWGGVMVGAVAIFIMSTTQGLKGLSLKTMSIGLASGTCFALTSLWVREASLTLDLPVLHRAGWVLLSVISLQTILMVSYLLLKDRLTLSALWQRPRLTLLTSATSCFGSIGWFSAMALQAVPYVKTLGQVEVFFTMLIAVFWLKQSVKIKDGLGLILIAIAAVMVMWV